MTKWVGDWWSEQYPSFFVKGTVSADLPEDITALNDTEVDIVMKYTGFYRSGDVEHLRGITTYDEGTINMTVKYNNGILSYTINVSDGGLNGKYTLTNPHDRGSVRLQRLTEGKEDNSYCLLS